MNGEDQQQPVSPNEGAALPVEEQGQHEAPQQSEGGEASQ